MKKLLTLLATASLITLPALSSEYDGRGCMRRNDCVYEVYEVKSEDYEGEVRDILTNLEELHIGVYKAFPYYFKENYRGLYYSDANVIYLNMGHIDNDDEALIDVLRHEGWHVVQDCKAGLYNTSLERIYMNSGVVPSEHTENAIYLYGLKDPTIVRIEREALWAGATPGMTIKSLKECILKYETENP
tara:strand:+ start:885 stop:1448 length:564 start_codon:yes stop_codon:yes gene_type:complete